MYYRRRPQVFLLLTLLVLWSSLIGLLITQVSHANQYYSSAVEKPLIANVDIVPARYQLSQELYLENCASCHVGIPPQVLPTESWRQILSHPQHYGVVLPTILEPGRQLIWQYLQVFSRNPTKKEENLPYRLSNSHYFQILHPGIELPKPTNLKTCAVCHPQADQFNYRVLSADWQN